MPQARHLSSAAFSRSDTTSQTSDQDHLVLVFKVHLFNIVIQPLLSRTRVMETTTQTATEPKAEDRPDQAAVPYRGPRLPAVPDDLVIPGIFDIECDERLWVPQAPGVWFRPLLFPSLEVTSLTFFASAALASSLDIVMPALSMQQS